MAKTKEPVNKENETYFQLQRRLKSRKQNFKMTYKKGIFYNNPDRLIEYLKQNDVVIRVHASGGMDDDTDFITISIEGFKSGPDGI